MLKWDDPIGFIPGATTTVRKAWRELGIETVGDLLRMIPHRYDDFSQTRKIGELVNGETVTVRGVVEGCKQMQTFRRHIKVYQVLISDETGRLKATFFQQPWVVKEFVAGREILLSGKVGIDARYGMTLVHPIWEPGDGEAIAAGRIAPVYSLAGTLAQKTYRRLMQEVLETVAFPEDVLPESVRERVGLLGFREAIVALHQPSSAQEAERGRERFAFDELLRHALALRLSQEEIASSGAPIIPFQEVFAKKFVGSLPYPLTDDQKRVAWTALQDMEQPRPMRRLLQGDVGSGKTVVAAFLLASVVHGGASGAMLVPTDILATQHAETLYRLFAPFLIPVILATRTKREELVGKERHTLTPTECDARIRQGNCVVLGTHALLYNNRLPDDLALSVIDEQHRFGVAQREQMVVLHRPDGRVPHLLSMTATPIPRSLALTLYGDLQVSLIQQKPAGRLPIQTVVCVHQQRERAYEAIRTCVVRGERAFLVCPLIEANDTLGVRAVEDEAKRLAQGPLQGLKIATMHGRMKPQERDEIMQKLVAGDVQVLVATSVIEVGVDVPMATVIAIEGAERFGLAQLHQLRGRVGRSHRPSACYLMTDVQGESLARLELVTRMQDGFTLAEEDLKARGAGNLFGREQSGIPSFSAARVTDVRLMAQAKELADEAMRDHANWQVWIDAARALRDTGHLE